MNWRPLLLGLALIALGFMGGYNAAQLGMPDRESEIIEQESGQSNTSLAEQTETVSYAWLDMEQALASRQQTSNEQNPNVSLAVPVEEDTDSAQSNSYEWQNPDDIVAMFNELMRLSEPGNEDGIKAFSSAIDQLRIMLAESPTQLATVVDHMQTLDLESKEFHYLTAILQGLPDEKGYSALESAALRLIQRDDQQSRQKFLHFVSNSDNSADNPEILAELVDIALYSELSANTKLEALDLVMPFQITQVEKQQILSHINSLLESSDGDAKGPLVNHALRFSDSQERERMATKFISNENDIELRYSILNGLHAGTVPRSENIKTQLFSIASDPADPLNNQAKHALMYLFDISNIEYQRIKEQ